MEVELVSTANRKSVSQCSRGAGGVNAVCHTYAGGVVAVGNDVMKQPKVVPIYWGNTILGNSELKLAFDQFFAELLNSSYVDRLAQYNVGQPLILPSHVIGGTSTNVTSSDVANQLTAWFKNDTIPTPQPPSDAPNWYYVILAPPGATVGSAGECGYHSSSLLSINAGSLLPIPIDQAWGLVYFPPPAAGATSASVVNSVCYCLVHEMFEAFTNPRGQGWSVNVAASGGNAGQNCEIGDLCETKPFHNVGRWSVETYWSNQDQACVGAFAPDWVSLGAPTSGVLGSPVVGHNLDGRLEVYVVSNDGNLWHRWQGGPFGTLEPWQTVSSVNPGISGSARVGYNQDGRIELFGMQSGGVLWHVWQTVPNGGWSDGAVLGSPDGGIIGGVTVVSNVDGRLEVFGVGSDHQLHHMWQTSPNGGWSSWGSLGWPWPNTTIQIGDPRVVRNADGRLEVFLLGNDQKIWHAWQTAPNGGWGAWASLGSPPVEIANGAPYVGSNADGRVEVFVTGSDGGIYHTWQTAPGAGWSPWELLLGPLPGVQFDGLGEIANNKDGRFQLFFIGSDGALWTMPQSSPSSGWSPVRFLDGAPPAQALNGDQIPGAGLNFNGDMSAFVVGQDGNVWQITQISPGGSWGGLIKD